MRLCRVALLVAAEGGVNVLQHEVRIIEQRPGLSQAVVRYNLRANVGQVR